jgi:hypothetical protein
MDRKKAYPFSIEGREGNWIWHFLLPMLALAKELKLN